MAVQIIGEAPKEATSAVLPMPDVRLPGPETAEPVRKFFSVEHVRALLRHPDPIVRGFAVGHVSQRRDVEGFASALIESLQDEDTYVFHSSLDALAEHAVTDATDPIAQLFLDSQGFKAGQLAKALSKLDSSMLRRQVQQKGRLDDETFPHVTMAFAVTGGPEELEYLRKAMRRAGLLKVERLGALYTAVLLSGDTQLCHDVLGQAIGESNAEAPGNSVFPGRVAVAGLAGLHPDSSRLAFGDNIYREASTIFNEAVVPALAPHEAESLTLALKEHRPGDIIRALEPLLQPAAALAEAHHPRDLELASVARRRQGALSAFVRRARDFERLEQPASALFLAAAAQSAAIVASWLHPEHTSAAASNLAKALTVDANNLVAESMSELSTRFETLSAREMRRVHSILAHQPCRRASTLERFSEAIARAGHGAGLLTAVSESEDETLRGIVISGMRNAEEDLETAVLEILDESTLDPKSTALALECAEQLGTERLALAVGRRFFELRTLHKTLTARALLASGDPRVLPLLESRAFADEPEEGAWVVLSMVHGADEKDDRLGAALTRVRALRAPSTEPERLHVELVCEHCNETATYTFERAYIDPEKADEWGDPAFVGPVICKACKTEERLKPTPEGGQVIVLHTMQAIQMMREGIQGPNLVTPNRITVDGKPVGLAEAYRRANQRVGDSPHSIRHRLERLHLRMILKRAGMEEDLSAIREHDPHAIEADIIEATHLARQGQIQDALGQLTQIHDRLVAEGDDLRLYEVEAAKSLQTSLEDLLLQIADDGYQVAAHIDLTPARKRRQAFERLIEEQMKRQSPGNA